MLDSLRDWLPRQKRNLVRNSDSYSGIKEPVFQGLFTPTPSANQGMSLGGTACELIEEVGSLLRTDRRVRPVSHGGGAEVGTFPVS